MSYLSSQFIENGTPFVLSKRWLLAYKTHLVLSLIKCWSLCELDLLVFLNPCLFKQSFLERDTVRIWPRVCGGEHGQRRDIIVPEAVAEHNMIPNLGTAVLTLARQTSEDVNP